MPLSTFPHDAVPDGAGHVFAPHHSYLGFLLVILLAAIVWDNHRRREPWGVMLGAFAGIFAFGFIWPYYPRTGATFCLVATGGLLASIPIRWRSFWHRHRRMAVAVAVAGLIALDDVAEHSLGIWTPLDWLFNNFAYQVMRAVFGGL